MNLRSYFKLTKAGIGLFVMISGLAGYAASLPMGYALEISEPIVLLLGLYLLSSGSFALNQAQEWRADAQMPRTAKRPVPAGEVAVWQAYALGVIFCVVGVAVLALLRPSTAGLGLLTVVLYNGIYTLYWKKKWAFGAVPGAIPGAMPVVIGYSANTDFIFAPDCVYLFLIMFLWQMPHFWSLAVRYKDDYTKGGFPVLPARIGVERTLYHVGLYTFAYIGVAIAAPWFVNTHVLYLIVILPLALKVLWEFFAYYRAHGTRSWLPFFLWVNLSMLAFVCVPVFDKWLLYLLNVSWQ